MAHRAPGLSAILLWLLITVLSSHVSADGPVSTPGPQAAVQTAAGPAAVPAALQEPHLAEVSTAKLPSDGLSGATTAAARQAAAQQRVARQAAAPVVNAAPGQPAAADPTAKPADAAPVVTAPGASPAVNTITQGNAATVLAQQPAPKRTERHPHKPAEQQAEQPIQQPAAKPAEQPAQQPAPKAAEEPVPKPAEQPATKRTERHPHRPAEQQAEQPVQQPAEQPAQQPAAQPAPKVREQPVQLAERHPHKPVEEQVVQPAPQPVQQPAAKQVEQPAHKRTERHAHKPGEQPAVQPAPQPAEQPAAKPAEQPPHKATVRRPHVVTQQPAPKPAETPSPEPAEQPAVQQAAEPEDDAEDEAEQPAAAAPDTKTPAPGTPADANRPTNRPGQPRRQHPRGPLPPMQGPMRRATRPRPLHPMDRPAEQPAGAVGPRQAELQSQQPHIRPMQQPAGRMPAAGGHRQANRPVDRPDPAASDKKQVSAPHRPVLGQPPSIEPIRLFLLATFGQGVKPPSNGVKLIADAILTKHVDCVQEAAVAVTARPFGSHYRARPRAAKDTAHGGTPVPPPVNDEYEDGIMLPMILSEMKRKQPGLAAPGNPVALPLSTLDGVELPSPPTQQVEPPASNSTVMSVPPEAVSVAQDPPAAAMCKGSFGSVPGLYSLLAASVEGADWATWSCLTYRTSTKDERGFANVTAVEMYSPGAVELVPGFTYTCIAYYPKANPANIAAARAKDWDSSITEAVQGAVQAANAATCTPMGFSPPLRGVPPPPIQIKGNRLTAAGKPLEIHGLNWFGFNVPMGVVDGLWAGGTDLASDFGKISYQLRLLGYNAVRLPYTHRNLLNTQVSDVVRECAPTTADDLKQRVTDPEKFGVAQTKQLPANASPLFNKQAGYCNTHLPGTNNMDRFLFVIQQFIAQGLYVILDYQPMGTEDYAYNLDKFVTQWALVWKQVTCLPNWGPDIAGRVFVDIMNEPDSMGIRWEANNDRPGAQQLYLGTSDALWRITPNQVMFMYEGTGQNMMGLSWGNGFVTDLSIIQSRGLSDANGFFQRLVTRPYAKQVVITPHVYPPSITGATFLAKDLWEQSRVAFGYLQGPGYCGAPMAQTEADSSTTTQAIHSEGGVVSIAAAVGRRLRKLLSRHPLHMANSTAIRPPNSVLNGTANSTVNGTVAPGPAAPAPAAIAPGAPRQAGCTVFPVVIGETGSNFQSATDRTWLNDFADFVTAKDGAAAYNPQPLAGWLWWAYNENSMDTGGIVMNQWQDINWEKIRYMTEKLGLTAWHVNAPDEPPPAPGAPARTPIPPAHPQPSPTAPRTPTTPPVVHPTPPVLSPTPRQPHPHPHPHPHPQPQPLPQPQPQPQPKPQPQPMPMPQPQPQPMPPKQPEPQPQPQPKMPEPQPQPQPQPKQPQPQPQPQPLPQPQPRQPVPQPQPIADPEPPRRVPRNPHRPSLPPSRGIPGTGFQRPTPAFRPDLNTGGPFDPGFAAPRDPRDRFEQFPEQRRFPDQFPGEAWRPPANSGGGLPRSTRRPEFNPDVERDFDATPIRRGTGLPSIRGPNPIRTPNDTPRNEWSSSSQRGSGGSDWSRRVQRGRSGRAMDNTINDLVETMMPKRPQASTSYGGDRPYGGNRDKPRDEHRYERDGGSSYDGPAFRGPAHKGTQGKEGFKTPAHEDPYHNGPLLDGPALIAPKPKPKHHSRDKDPQDEYWYGMDDDEADEPHGDREYAGDKDDEDEQPRKSPRKYKSLDSPDDKPSFKKDEPEDDSSPTKDSNDTDKENKQQEAKDKEPSEPCINIDDIPAAKGGYKFVPPGQRKNLCKKPAPATKPDGKDKKYKSLSDADADGKEDKHDDSPAADKPAETDDKPSNKQDSSKSKNSKKSEKPQNEEEQEGDKRSRQRDSRREDKSGDADDRPHMHQEEEEQDGKRSKKHGSSRHEEEEEHEEYPKQEEEIWIYHPWPIVRDHSINFKVPEEVQENFWLKANRDGFMYMPKWDPQLAQDGYHPHFDRAGNNPVIIPKDMWKNIGGDYGGHPKQRPHGGEHDKMHDSRDEEYRRHSRDEEEEEHRRHGGSRHELEHPYSRDSPDSKEREHWVRATRLPDGTIKLPNGALLRPSQPGYPSKMKGPDTLRALGRAGSKGSSSQTNSLPFHSGNSWFWSFGKASPRAQPTQAVTSGVGAPTTVSLQSTTAPQAAAPAAADAVLQATTQGTQAGKTSPEVMYWAYNAAGQMVPVYVESQGTPSAAEAMSAEAYEEAPAGAMATAVNTASAGSAQAQDTVTDLAAYTELADDYEEMPAAATGSPSAFAATALAATASIPTAATASQGGASTAAAAAVPAAAAAPAAAVATASTSTATAAGAAPAAATAQHAVNESGEEVLTLSAIEVKLA